MIRNWAWLNGVWLEAETLAIPVWDAGFVFGATVTDLCRTINHRLFRWPDHVHRFFKSAELCHVPIGYSPDEILATGEQLVARQTAALAAHEDLALVVFATPGPVEQYRPAPSTAVTKLSAAETAPTVGMHTFRLPLARYARLWREGYYLSTVPVVAPSEHALPRQAKHRSRLHYWRAQRMVPSSRPGMAALLCDADGCLLETAFANLVLVQGDALLSPPAERILHGISLQFVAELAQRMGWKVHYRPLFPADVARAEEAFLTSSSFCLLPVRQIDGKEFPCPGAAAQRLIQAWSETVGYDLLAQLSQAGAASSGSP
jgi:branched-chain amino acid aminotransferase